MQESFVVNRVRNSKNYKYKCSDISPKEPEQSQSLTGESSTSTLVINLQHGNNNVEHMDMFRGLTPLDPCNNPHLVDQYDSEFDKKPGNIIFQHLVESFDSEYEKRGNLYLLDESCSSPKVSCSFNFRDTVG